MSNVLAAILAAVFFGSASLVARSAPMSYVSLSLLVGGGTAFTALILAVMQKGGLDDTINHLIVGNGPMVVLAGLLNGVGLILFYRLIEQAQTGVAEMGRMIPMVLAIMPLVIVLGGVVFYKETISVSKVLGTILILSGVYVINR